MTAEEFKHCFLLLQMVVVSDDVHEYAVALKDTDEKIARCPARVNSVSFSAVILFSTIM